MKNNLKTLKDIEYDDSGKKDFLCESKDLRQEAINWIKQIDKSIYNDPRLRDKCPYCNYSMNDKNNNQKIAQKFILMEFFNITDEDLKEK